MSRLMFCTRKSLFLQFSTVSFYLGLRLRHTAYNKVPDITPSLRLYRGKIQLHSRLVPFEDILYSAAYALAFVLPVFL